MRTHGQGGLCSVAPSVVVIGASTGGTRVLPELLKLLPPLRACILIVQHMPKYINASVVRSWSQDASGVVKLAQQDEILEEGIVLVAPSEVHCVLTGNRRINLEDGPRVNFVRPAIDVTMRSFAPLQPGQKLFGVLMTGMGKDGALGLAHIKGLGGCTIAQNEATCAIYGMPAAAVKLGVVNYELPPEAIARVLASALG